METQSKNSSLKAFVLWYIGTGLAMYIVGIIFLTEWRWLGADGNFSLQQTILQAFGTVVLWPIEILFGINRLGFSVDGRYGSWFRLGIILVSLAVGWWVVRKRMKRSA